MTTPDESLLSKVASKLREPPADAEAGMQGSILTAAAASYGTRPQDEESTMPTGFDPLAAALFEATVECAFLVANADGEFDETEQRAFKQVVQVACGNKVGEGQLTALLADLTDLLEEDGIPKRIRMVARTITRPDHAREVLRIAGLIAHISGGVSDVERDVLEKLASEFRVEAGTLDETLGEVARALSE